MVLKAEKDPESWVSGLAVWAGASYAVLNILECCWTPPSPRSGCWPKGTIVGRQQNRTARRPLGRQWRGWDNHTRPGTGCLNAQCVSRTCAGAATRGTTALHRRERRNPARKDSGRNWCQLCPRTHQLRTKANRVTARSPNPTETEPSPIERLKCSLLICSPGILWKQTLPQLS